MQKEVLIIIPAYNEEKNISKVLDRLEQPEIAEFADILVMNDASSDNTNWIVKARHHAVVTHVFNLGYGSALQLGYKYAIRCNYRYVIQMDADGQHDVCNIPKIYETLQTRDANGELPDIVLRTTLIAGFPGETQEQGGQAGGMSICMDEYKADPRLILGYHVVPGQWLLQGGTTGGGGVMRWFEREFADYERSVAGEKGSSLNQLNEIAEKVAPGSDGVVFLPYMSGERSPIWNPNAKGVFYGLDFAKTKGHMVRACMEGVALSLKHNLEVAKEAGADVEVLRAMGGSANSLLWTQIKSDITGKPIVVPSSDTATTLGAAILAGVGVGMYQDYDEAIRLTVKETRRHEPNPENRDVYEKTYKTYLNLYKSLEPMMRNEEEK